MKKLINKKYNHLHLEPSSFRYKWFYKSHYGPHRTQYEATTIGILAA